MKFYSLVLITIWTSVVFGQKTDEMTTTQTIGFELDMLPFISGGYYGSVWYGFDNFRLREVIAKTTVPEFMLDKGFKDNELMVYAVIADYFFEKNFKGFWIAAGMEYWDSEIAHETETQITIYSNTVFTAGGGYVWKFYENFYLNPWAAFHVIVAGDKDIKVGNHIFNPAVFTPEISLKIGWHF